MPRITRSKRLVIPQGATTDAPATWVPTDALNRPALSSEPVVSFPWERVFGEPGAVLFWLGNSISGLRVAAKHWLAREDELCTKGWIEGFFRAEWRALGPDGAAHVRWLDQAMRQEEGLLVIEYIAMALGVQGEDGIGVLLELLQHDDPSIRHKAAIGLGASGREARWTVPAIARYLERDSGSMVAMSLLLSLIKIGGSRAERMVEARRFGLNDVYRPFVEDAMDAEERREREDIQ